MQVDKEWMYIDLELVKEIKEKKLGSMKLSIRDEIFI